MTRHVPAHRNAQVRAWTALLLGVILSLTAVATPARAAATEGAVFVVTSTGDGSDANAGDGVCDDGAGSCTLRAAIDEANATTVGDTIRFGLGCPTVCVISPAWQLPDIAAPLVIDGYSAVGSAWGTNAVEDGLGSNAVLKIALDGASAGTGAVGLTVSGGKATIRGLVVSDFSGGGIVLNGTGANLSVVEGDFIGTDATGTQRLGNGSYHNNYGVTVLGAGGVTIGGQEPGQGNVISGNRNGIRLFGAEANNNKVLGNLIGTSAAGTGDLGNDLIGIRIDSGSANTIGRATGSGGRNVIAGNDFYGIAIVSGATGNVVQGNLIGTDVTGTVAIGNSTAGVLLSAGAVGTVIGGSGAGEGNVVSGNPTTGILVDARNGTPLTGTVIQGNRIGTTAAGTAALPNGVGVQIFGGTGADAAMGNLVGGEGSGEGNTIAYNRQEGVFVSGAMATGNPIRANSIHDNGLQGINDDSGGNVELAAPVLAGGGSVGGTACASCRIDVFSDTADEGRAYHGSVTADALGNWSYPGTVTGPNVTATATDATGNTSEFSAPSLVTPRCQPGTFSATGLEPCADAPAGSYVAGYGATSATPCAIGTFSALPHATACDPAPVNTYVDTTGATSATPCAAGTTTNGQTGQSACVPYVTQLTVDTATGAGKTTVSTSAGSLYELAPVSEGYLGSLNKPNGRTFPYGFFEWTIGDLTPGQTITVTLTLPGAVPAGSAEYWKVLNDSWTDATTLVGSDDGDNVLTLTITDGGSFDADGAADGVITDPGGPGWTVTVPTWDLTVVKAGSGTGTVTSQPAGIDCGSVCAGTYQDRTTVTLTATPAADSSFAGWSGDADCADGQVTMSAATTCRADFRLIPTWDLTVVRTGSGMGTVTSQPVGIDCGSDCSEIYPDKTVVALTATPAADSRFVAFGGDADCADGTVTMDLAVACTATFDLVTRNVGAATGNGSIQVTTGTGSLDALSAVAEGTLPTTGKPSGVSFPYGFVSWTVSGLHPGDSATVTLTFPGPIAVGAQYWKVVGGRWVDATSLIGDDDGDSTLTLNITDGGPGDADGVANGTIVDPGAPGIVSTIPMRLLTITKTGNGSGTVTSRPAGIDCGAVCAASFPNGSIVTLTATPAAGSYFNGWAGPSACASGEVTMSAALTCQANFRLVPMRLLTVTKTGNGSGSVTSEPAGIDCGADCSESYPNSTIVTLTATPAADSIFINWGGGVRLRQRRGQDAGALTCQANFRLIPMRLLTITKTGNGSGTVTSRPAGIDCGAVCAASFPNGSIVTLTATPAAGSYFNDWAGRVRLRQRRGHDVGRADLPGQLPAHPDAPAHDHQDRERERHRHEPAGGHRLRRGLRRVVPQRVDRDPDRHAGGGLLLQRLGRPVRLRQRRGHDVGRADLPGQLPAHPDAPAHDHQDRERERHRHEPAGGHRLRRGLRRVVPQRVDRDPDRHAGGGLLLQRLGRPVRLRQRRGHDVGRADLPGQLPAHPDAPAHDHQDRERERHRHEPAGGHRLRRGLRRVVPQRVDRDPDRHAGGGLLLQRLGRPVRLRQRRGHDVGRADLPGQLPAHPDAPAHDHQDRERERHRHEPAGGHRLRRGLRRVVPQRVDRDPDRHAGGGLLLQRLGRPVRLRQRRGHDVGRADLPGQLPAHPDAMTDGSQATGGSQ